MEISCGYTGTLGIQTDTNQQQMRVDNNPTHSQYLVIRVSVGWLVGLPHSTILYPNKSMEDLCQLSLGNFESSCVGYM